MDSSVVFKGRRQGLQLIIDESAEFETVLAQLKLKLQSAGDFFVNSSASVQIPDAKRRFTDEQQKSLITLFENYGLTLQHDENDNTSELAEAECSELPADENDDLIISKTVRSGQEIVHNGSVVIMGDVNPGAKVIAGGDIIVHGACRGVAHAGALGDTNATITADRLIASQIRIAGLISRSPDNVVAPEWAETARIKDGVVIIEPANRRFADG